MAASALRLAPNLPGVPLPTLPQTSYFLRGLSVRGELVDRPQAYEGRARGYDHALR